MSFKGMLAKADRIYGIAHSISVPETITRTDTATSGTVRTYNINHTNGANSMSKITEVLRVSMDSEYYTGDWTNAIVGRIDFGDAGDARGGMAAAICAEMNMPAKSYASIGGPCYSLDCEFNCPTSFVAGERATYPIGFIKFGAWGGAVGEFDDEGCLFHVDGLTAGSGHLLSANSRTLRVNIGGTEKFLYLSDTEDDLGTMVVDSITLSSSVTDAILISGACSDNGIEITGVCSGAGILINSASAYGIHVYADCTSAAMRVENQSGLSMQLIGSLTLSSANLNSVEISVDSTANADYEARALYALIYPSTAAQATAGLIAGYFVADVANALNTDFMKGVLAYLDLSAASTLATGGAGCHGIVNVDAATTVSSGSVAAVKAQVLGDSALTGSLYCLVVDADMDVDAGIDIDNATAKTMSVGINMTANGAITTGIAMTGAGGMTTGISLGAAMTDGLLISGACSDNGIEISGDCTGAGLLMSGTNGVDIELPNGATIDNNAAGTLTITEDSISLVAGGYGKILLGGGIQDWGAGTEGTLIDGNGYDCATLTVAHVDSGALATACAAGYHALTVTATSHSTASSFFGTWTELYFADSMVLTGAANAAAVWGQVECLGTVTSPDSGDFMAAGYFNFITGGLLTLTTGSHVSGVRVKGEINSITGSGILSAISVNAATTEWPYGAYMENCERALYAATNPNGSSAMHAIDLAITDTTATSGGDGAGLHIGVTYSGDHTGTGWKTGIALDYQITGNNSYCFAQSIWMGDCGDAVIGSLDGIYIYMEDVGGSATVSQKNALDLNIDNGDNVDPCSYLRLYDHSGSTMVDNVLYLANAGHGGANFLMYVGASGGLVQVAQFSNDTIGTTVEDGYVRISIAGTEAKIPFWYDNA